MSKRLFTLMLLFAFVQVSFAAWNGSAKIPKVVKSDGQDYYEITSPEELVGFLDSLVKSTGYDESLKAYLKNDIVFGTDTSKLCSKKWVRNPDQGLFQGIFDGKGHTVYGLNAERSLFGTIGINVGTVRNLNVANSAFGSDTVYQVGVIADLLRGVVQNVKVFNTKVVSGADVGGIAGRMISSDDELTAIINCHVVGGSVTGGAYVGGIVGSSRGRILGCTNSAQVRFVDKLTERTDYSYNIFVGGIAGYAESQPGYAIQDCINRGKVEHVSAYTVSYVGGVVGQVLGSISNLQNYGDVSSKVAYASDTASSYWQMYSYVGGVAGSKHLHRYETGELRDFLNEGNVTAVVESGLAKGEFAVGGVFGENKYMSIRNALNKGSVKANGYGGLLKTFVGGVIGYAPLSANISGFDKLGNRGSVEAEGVFRTYVGGVLGWFDRPASQDIALRRSYNYGNVTGSVVDTASKSEELDVGGIAGYAYGVMISDVFNRGNVVAKGELSYGGSSVGGIAGRYTYPDYYIQNSYSAASTIKGDSVGGLVGYINAMVSPYNAYYDVSLSDVKPFGDVLYDDMVKCDDCQKTTSQLQSDKMLAVLNTINGEVPDRKIWVRYDGYPVFTFDSLYKNDSIFFDIEEYAMPSKRLENDTLIYTISTAAEMRNFLEMGPVYDWRSRKFKVELANDIVMGEDTLHLSKRKIANDTNGVCYNMLFNGNGHTIYGLNMSRAMFYCIDTTSLVENLTIANSRFENEYGMPAAGVAVRLGQNACIRNVKIRDSFVYGGDKAAGIVAQNYGVVRNDTNVNTTVVSSNISGGIIAENYQVAVENANSGRVSGRLVGGIAGYAAYYGASGSVQLLDNSNDGMILGVGAGSVSAGGIVGYVVRGNVIRNQNTGLVEGGSTLGTLTIGGIAGRSDSTGTTSNVGNWGRIHALSGKKIYAGGIAGLMNGRFTSWGNGNLAPTDLAVYMFNYGPVTVKSSDSIAYAAGLVGRATGISLYNSYNRGTVKNEGASSRKYTGGIAASADGVRVITGYNYSDTLSGDGVASIVYEFANGWNTVNRIYYGGSTAPAVVKYSADTSNVYYKDSLNIKTFEEMLQDSLSFLAGSDWIYGKCMPQLKQDTTSSCAVKVVKDSFGDSDLPYVVGYKESLVYATADTSSHGGETFVKLKVMVPLMQIEVSARNITVMGLDENRPVMIFDMRGYLIVSSRVHGAVVNLSVPRAGRYIVRSGKQTRIVNIR